MNKIPLFVTVLACIAVVPRPELSEGQERWIPLSGHVYELDGKPLSGATISLFPLEVGVAGPMPSAISGKDGGYELRAPALGKTRICARLDRLGYPDTTGKLFASPEDHFPEVNLTPGAVLSGVDIHLGPPDGHIEGDVVDKNTREAIQLGRITLRWAEDPSVFMSASLPRTGHFEYALPRRPITITITAPGYRPWMYLNPSGHDQFIVLTRSDHIILTVELERTAPSGNTP